MPEKTLIKKGDLVNDLDPDPGQRFGLGIALKTELLPTISGTIVFVYWFTVKQRHWSYEKYLEKL